MDSKEREAVAPRTHFLKTWPEHFEAVMSGAKRFELRVNDRDFRVGDRLELTEFDPGLDGGFTGRECDVDVIHILHGGAFGLPDGHVIMSIAPAVDTARREAYARIIDHEGYWERLDSCNHAMATVQMTDDQRRQLTEVRDCELRGTAESLAKADAILALRPAGEVVVWPNDQPPPHWTPDDPYDRHPKTADEWNWRTDPIGDEDQRRGRMLRRLNFAGDMADPRAPDQMALVLRKDLINVKHRLITAEARAKIFREQLDAAAPPISATEGESALSADVVRLVIAARGVAFDDHPTPEALRKLDAASEAFADRVPWEDQP